MKTEEDEAFDDLARRQGMWGGGFQAKRQMAADKLQEPWNEDEWRRNNWRCGHGWLRGEQCEICNAAQEPVNLLEARLIADEYGTPDSQVDSGNLYFALSKCLEHIDAQPVQEPVAQEKIHALKPMLEALRIKQVVSFSESQTLLAEVANKSGMLPPAFEISGNQWCALVNLAVARFGNNALPVQPVQEPDYWLGYGLQAHTEKPFENATALYIIPPKREWIGLTDEEREGIAQDYSLTGLGYQSPFKAIEAKLKDKNT
jgi:hypothetical protein